MDRMPAPQRSQRLREIAQRLEVVPGADFTPLCPPTQIPTFSVPDDERKADAILGQLKIEESQGQPQPKGLRRAFTKSQKPATYTYRELYAALSRVIEDDGLPGVAEVLLRRFKTVDGDINVARRSSTGMISRIRTADNQPERGRLIQRATELRRHVFVQILVPHANSESLDESLHIALVAREIPIISTLLQYGANAKPHENEFSQAVENCDTELLGPLLRSRKRVSDECVTRNLLLAVNKGHLPTILLLVGAGANGDHDSASALKCAVEMARLDIVTALVVGKNPPSGASLDRALDYIFTTPSSVINNSYDLIEVLLCAGPVGNAMNEGLFKATFLVNLEMMHLLLAHKANINYDRAVSIGHAIQRNRGDLVGILLQDQILKPELASELVGRILEKAPAADRVAILSKLLVHGASGTQCSQLLITAADQGDLDTARMLVSSRDANGSPICSVDYNAARCLQSAVARNSLAMVKLLALEGAPSKFSLEKAFSSIPIKLSKDDHFLMVQVLLRAGTEGPEVDAALHAAVTSPRKSNRLIELLVQSGAAVSDETLFSSVTQGSLEILKILLLGKVSPQSCCSAIALAMKLHTHKLRYQIIQHLLGPATAAGLESPWVNQAVVEILQNCPEDKPLLRLLCVEGKANINLQGGFAVVVATKNNDHELLDIVLQSEGGLPNATTVEEGLRCAIDLPPTYTHRTHKVESLLARTKPQQAINESLIKEIKSAIALKQDHSVIQVLLASGADVNTDEGAPVFWAVRDPAIMDLVLSKRPIPQSLPLAFRQAITLNEPARYKLCEKLLRAGAVGEEIDKALSAAAKEGPAALPLMKLLLPQANVNYMEGRALRLAVHQVFLEGLDLLLTPRSEMPSMATKVSGFHEAMRIKNIKDRHSVVKKLLKAGIRPHVISDALIIAVNGRDLELTELLLQSSASVDHNSGQAVLCAASLGEKEILKLLVEGKQSNKPTLSTLTSGFAGAGTLKNKDPEAYYMVTEILLKAGTRGEAIHAALVDAVKKGDQNLRFSELLCSSGASAEWNEGEAINIAATSGYVGTLELLLQRNLDQKENVLKRAYRSTSAVPKEQRYQVIELLLKAGKLIDKHVTKTLTEATQESPPDLELIKMLLDYQVFDEGECIFHAASVLDLQTLTLLVDSPKAADFISSSFKNAMSTDFLWQSHKGLSIVEIMLKKGASGDAVGEALYHAIEKSESGSDDLAKEFLDLLLRFGADVNYQRGLALQRASLQANVDLIQKLLPNATTNTKAMAIPYLFTACENATTILKAIQAFNDSLLDEDEGFFFSFQHPDSQLEPVLFAALSKFPQKPQILRALLDTGYNPNQWKMEELDPIVGMEQWAILCWALDQPQKRVSNINIELLIEEGANVNFTSKSGMTAVMLAIQNQRSNIVSKLISKGAKVTVTDPNGITPLALASRLGNADIMEQLLKAGAERNDGSLHDAARELRCDAMRVLIRGDHQVDYPSERHDGRSAMAELCLNAVNLSPEPVEIEEAIMCLVAYDADIGLKCVSADGVAKTIFHYALDSADPLAILTVLLKVMWQRINDPSFIYKDRTYSYSLTMYVEKDVFKGPPDQKAGILSLLRNKRAIDRFWANDIEAQQPKDYCGAPEDIEKEVQHAKLIRKRRSERLEDVKFELDMKRLAAVKEVELLDFQSEADLRRTREKAQVDVHLLTEFEDTKLQLEVHAEGQRQRLLMEKQSTELNHVRSLGSEQVSTRQKMAQAAIEEERTRQVLQIEYVDMNIKKENEGVKARLAIEGSARQDMDNVDKRQHERHLARMKMQKSVIESSTALAGRIQNSGMNQAQIGYIAGEVP